MKKLLFVCSQNKFRSPTAEVIFANYPGIETLSAGTNNDAIAPISGDLIAWTDIVLVMEKHHKNKVSKKFGNQLGNRRLVVLNVPDNFEYMQEELVQLLKAKLPRYIRL